ncbi:MAG: hypothetical protein IPN03_17040 [Holophagales bacterium]|nr:hypothetical protein [Holophagales bacterium]
METVLISTAAPGGRVAQEIETWVATKLAPRNIDGWMRDRIHFIRIPQAPSSSAGRPPTRA